LGYPVNSETIVGMTGTQEMTLTTAGVQTMIQLPLIRVPYLIVGKVTILLLTKALMSTQISVRIVKAPMDKLLLMEHTLVGTLIRTVGVILPQGTKILQMMRRLLMNN
jgi:hypothetical protein